MEPISKFSHDEAIYIYQPQITPKTPQGPPPQKPFVIESPEKSNKAKNSKKQKQEKNKENSS